MIKTEAVRHPGVILAGTASVCTKHSNSHNQS